ncbi:TIGR03089 family protein [Nocardiopsis ansamitocini]|uniref:Acyl-CoA synthetase n=1 Tax=Nocardiopsis ansamitocini TaxID=1670832 RepID=A0A9W6UKI1_9ACTN|nr:TIGR03089 family protein [Nocardiopsis ansamitocini]GLU49623.1 acyl-CoA synthetase [Nocardiopsis ansamitocini]
MSAQTPLELWRTAKAADSARPFVTAYDEATGGRVELSYATFDNWVSKTANMLVDGLAAEPGDRVAIALPLHWQSLAWVLACWSTGLTVVAAEPGTVPEADIVVADAARLEAALATGAREVVGSSLHPLGLPLADCPPAAVDYSVEVRGYGDQFFAGSVDPAGSALEHGAARFTGAEIAQAARIRAEEWELTAVDRVAIIASTTDPLLALGPDLSRFSAVLAGAAAVVLTPDLDSASLQSRLGMERVTAVVGRRFPSGSPLKSLT